MATSDQEQKSILVPQHMQGSNDKQPKQGGLAQASKKK